MKVFFVNTSNENEVFPVLFSGELKINKTIESVTFDKVVPQKGDVVFLFDRFAKADEEDGKITFVSEEKLFVVYYYAFVEKVENGKVVAAKKNPLSETLPSEKKLDYIRTRVLTMLCKSENEWSLPEIVRGLVSNAVPTLEGTSLYRYDGRKVLTFDLPDNTKFEKYYDNGMKLWVMSMTENVRSGKAVEYSNGKYGFLPIVHQGFVTSKVKKTDVLYCRNKNVITSLDSCPCDNCPADCEGSCKLSYPSYEGFDVTKMNILDRFAFFDTLITKGKLGEYE